MTIENYRFKYTKTTNIPIPTAELFKLHTNIYNICQMVPDYIKIRVIEGNENLKKDDHVKLQIKIHGLSFFWESVIEEYTENEYFIDRMIKGPFRSWHHQHIFRKDDNYSILTDIIDYDIPLGLVGYILERTIVRNLIEKIFTIRGNFDINNYCKIN